MSSNHILREHKPDVADFVDRWCAKYQRSYDFTNKEDQATFYEGMVELGRHIPMHNGTASLGISVSVQGVSGVQVHVAPLATFG